MGDDLLGGQLALAAGPVGAGRRLPMSGRSPSLGAGRQKSVAGSVAFMALLPTPNAVMIEG